MKAGLLTIHDTLNYGSTAQTFGLYKAVESLGVDLEIIDYHCQAIAERETTYGWNELKSCSDVLRHFMYHKSLKQRKLGMRSFLLEHALISKCFDPENISNANEDYNVFLVGSDIVWGPKITGNDYSYFLDFSDEGKYKIAFSSSIGDPWTEEECSRLLPLVNEFHGISLREKTAAIRLSNLLGMDIPATCDPTMLWDKEFWKQYIQNDYAPKEKYILVYTHTKDKRNVKEAVTYGYIHNMPVYYINNGKPVKGARNIFPVTMGEWLSLFEGAEVVFSASFHGLVFSLYFEKQVFYYSRAHAERMNSLAEELGISYREGNGRNLSSDTKIDYCIVNPLIEQKRKDSWNHLRNQFLAAQEWTKSIQRKRIL